MFEFPHEGFGGFATLGVEKSYHNYSKLQGSARCKITFDVVVFRDRAGNDLNVENQCSLNLAVFRDAPAMTLM